MNKSLILTVVLALSSLCFAAQKSYKVTLSAPSTVGDVKLASGEYKVTVEGENAVFTNSKHESVSAPVKVATGTKKFQNTSVDASKDGGVQTLKAIELGGSTTRLEFAK